MRKGLLVLLSFMLIMSFVACAEEDGGSADTYSVTYIIDGGDSGEIAPVDSNSYKQGAVVTVLDHISKSKDLGTQVFDGWNPIQSYGGATSDNYIAGETFVMGSTNVTLYGQWHLE